MSPATESRVGAGLLILWILLAAFLLPWSIEKLILPSVTMRIGQSFYGVTLPSAAPYILGVGELILSFAFLIGAFRTISYGLALLVHTITIVVSWRQLLDPYGLAKIGNHLWIATWPAWGGFIAVFVMRQVDIYTIDRWREARSLEAR